MNEEFYSIGRGSLNINGKFYYGLDYEITDFMRSLEEENKQLKENYECILKQRDDLTKNATEQLESSVGIVKHNRAIQEHIDKERELQNQLQQKEEVIKLLLTYLDKNKLTLNNPNILDFYINIKEILNMNKGE